MLTEISAEFDSAYLADRAVARLKSSGVTPDAVRLRPSRRISVDPTLFVSYPYPMYGATRSSNESSHLPQTTGNSLMMPTPLLSEDRPQNGGAVRLTVAVPSADAARARGALINSHGRTVRSGGALPQ